MKNKDNNPIEKDKEKSGDKKGILLVIFLSVIALILTANAIKLQTENNEEDFSAFYSDTTESTSQTLPPVTDNVTVPTQTTAPDVSETESTHTTENLQPAELTKQDILQKFVQGVNSLKHETAQIKAKKTQNINLKLTECSLPAFVGIVNKVLEAFAGETVTEYTFSNGKAVDSKGNELTLLEAIPPTNKDCTLTIEGLADAKTQKDGNNTVYTVVIVPETSTMENPRPPHHNSAGDTFDCTKVELPIGEITKADFDYPGSEISITVDPEGRVVRYHQILKINGVGEGAALGMSASGRIEGSAEETWEITY